jgi:hypothetical protein
VQSRRSRGTRLLHTTTHSAGEGRKRVACHLGSGHSKDRATPLDSTDAWREHSGSHGGGNGDLRFKEVFHLVLSVSRGACMHPRNIAQDRVGSIGNATGVARRRYGTGRCDASPLAWMASQVRMVYAESVGSGTQVAMHTAPYGAMRRPWSSTKMHQSPHPASHTVTRPQPG